MKKKSIRLHTLKLEKRVIASLNSDETAKVNGGGPISQTCWGSYCNPSCTIDGTVASRLVSNCCATG